MQHNTGEENDQGRLIVAPFFLFVYSGKKIPAPYYQVRYLLYFVKKGDWRVPFASVAVFRLTGEVYSETLENTLVNRGEDNS